MTAAPLKFDEINYWTELKLEIIKKYGEAYTKAFARHPNLKKFYIDGFSGAGVHLSKQSKHRRSDLIHFDVDALDQSEVASTRLSEPNGPMRTDLAAALEIIMAYPNVAAFGIADINPERDVEGQMVQSTLAVIKGGVAGVAGSSGCCHRFPYSWPT
jgi:arginase family enzyme